MESKVNESLYGKMKDSEKFYRLSVTACDMRELVREFKGEDFLIYVRVLRFEKLDTLQEHYRLIWRNYQTDTIYQADLLRFPTRCLFTISFYACVGHPELLALHRLENEDCVRRGLFREVS